MYPISNSNNIQNSIDNILYVSLAKSMNIIDGKVQLFCIVKHFLIKRICHLNIA